MAIDFSKDREKDIEDITNRLLEKLKQRGITILDDDTGDELTPGEPDRCQSKGLCNDCNFSYKCFPKFNSEEF